MNLFGLFHRNTVPQPEQTVRVSDLLAGLPETVWVKTTMTAEDENEDDIEAGSRSVFLDVFLKSIKGREETFPRGDVITLLSNAVAYVHWEERDLEYPLESHFTLYQAGSPENLMTAEKILNEALAASAAVTPAPVEQNGGLQFPAF